jgi:MFS family permease
MQKVLEFITTYLFSGWDQLPFLLGAILANVVSGIILAGTFSWKVFVEKMKPKLVFYLIALIAIHFICYLPVDGVPLYKADIHIALVDLDINVFKTLNFVAVLYMASCELLSTDENIFQKYQRRFIPYFISQPLRKWVVGENTNAKPM